MSSGDKRTLRLGGLVIVEGCMHKFGDFCKSLLNISLFMKFDVMVDYVVYELLCYSALCKC